MYVKQLLPCLRYSRCSINLDCYYYLSKEMVEQMMANGSLNLLLNNCTPLATGGSFKIKLWIQRQLSNNCSLPCWCIYLRGLKIFSKIILDHFERRYWTSQTQIKFHLIPAPCLDPATWHRGPTSKPEDKTLLPTVSLAVSPLMPRACRVQGIQWWRPWPLPSQQ